MVEMREETDATEGQIEMVVHQTSMTVEDHSSISKTLNFHSLSLIPIPKGQPLGVEVEEVLVLYPSSFSQRKD